MKKVVLLFAFAFVLFSFSSYGQETQTPQKEGEELLKVVEETKAAEQPPTETKEAIKENTETSGEPVKTEEVKPAEEAPEQKKEPPVKKDATLLSPAIHGQTGLFRVYSAQRQRASWSSYSISAHGEWFKQNNFITLGDEVSRWQYAFAFTYVPIRYAEIFVSTFGFTNTGKANASLVQRMGDLRTGIKLGVDLGRVFSVGTNFAAEILNGAGDAGITSNAYSYDIRALLTMDFYKSKNIPIRLHANAGYRLDGTANATGVTPALSDNTQFFLNILPKDQITYGFAFEIPLKYLSIFAEYTAEILWDMGYKDCPQRTTVGTKIFPTRDQNISFDFGADFRLFNKNTATRAIALPAYNLIFGMSFMNFGKAKVAPPPPATTGKLTGKIVDAETAQPISAASIGFDDGLHNTIIAKDNGEYTTYDLPLGVQKITVSKEGYSPANLAPEVLAGQAATYDITLSKKKEEKGWIIFSIYNADDKPIAGTVTFLDFPMLKPYNVDTSKGGLKVKLKEGAYKVRISADQFEPEEKIVNLVGGKETPDKTVLREVKKVEIQKDKIIIKDKIHFATGKAEILTPSLSLLNRVADLIMDHPEITKLRIEGYTDSVGDADYNLKLSQKRAEAVKEYLVIRGIDTARVDAIGYGESNPIATNSTPSGRAVNRRVEFTIVNE